MRYLIQERLESVMIPAIDQNHVHWLTGECFLGAQSGESTANDNDFFLTPEHTFSAFSTWLLWFCCNVMALHRGDSPPRDSNRFNKEHFASLARSLLAIEKTHLLAGDVGLFDERSAHLVRQQDAKQMNWGAFHWR
jgi:hypothetical protein